MPGTRCLPLQIGLKWLFPVLVFLALQSCKKFPGASSEELTLSGKNFTETITQQQNLVFTFSHAIAPDSVIGQWDSTAYIQFNPAVSGRFRWNSARELVFSPMQGFAPSTDYTARLSDQLITLANLPKSATADGEKAEDGDAPTSLSKEELKFHTPYLTLQEASAYWTRTRGNEQVEQRLQLKFNYPVLPREVANRLTVAVGGKQASVQPLTSLASEEILLVVQTDVQAADEILPITLKLAKGLPLAAGKFRPADEITKEILLPGRSNLEVQNIAAAYEGTGPVIKIRTNQSLGAGQDFGRFIRVSPQVAFEVEEHEQGLDLKGEFLQGTTYQVTVSRELQGMFGTTLGEDVQQHVVFGDLEPAIGFVAKKGFYLTNRGSKNIGLRITSVPKIQVKVYKIYPNNILAFMREGNRYEYQEYGYDDYGFDWLDLDNYGSLVYERTYETARLPKAKGVQLLNLNFADVTDRQGFYVVMAQSTNDQWVKDQRIVSISDIGLIARETPDEVFVATNSIFTSDPIEGVEISLISKNNQTVARANTDKNGIARFRNLKNTSPGFSIAMVTAARDTDFNYLIFRSTRVETSRYEVGGARSNPTGYQAFVYGDRNIYRPGETIHVNTILRKETDKNLVALQDLNNLPIKLRLLLPNGREYKALQGKLNNQGAFATSIPVAAGAVTGTYQLEVLTANDVLLTSKYISIEEFIPDRIKLDLKTSAEAYSPGEQVQADITATNLFGPPAAYRNYEMQYTLQRKAFVPKALPDYTFALSGNERTQFQNIVRQGKTDAQGKATENFEVPANYHDHGLLQASVFATVFDESGRPVNRISKADIVTQPAFFGIKTNHTYVTPGQAYDFGLAALLRSEKPAESAQAQLQVIKYSYQTVIEQNYNGQYRYVSQRKEDVQVNRIITITNGRHNFKFVPMGSGEFEIRLSRPGAAAYVSHTFYAYGYGQTASGAFEVDREGQVSLAFDKTTYKPGDKAKVLFKTPFNGRLLVTVERNRVLEHFSLKTDKKAAQLELPVTDAHLPNVYITATLIRPTDDSDMPLTVAHGFATMLVEQPATKLPVQIVAAQTSRSQTAQTITVKTKPEADIQVTIAVVDEGILQLKNYQSPDPHAYFYQKRALEVNPYDLYAALLPELKVGKSSTGGDGYDLSRRVNPLTNKRVKLVSYWSGILRTNAKGEAKYKIDIPQFSGSLRVMAVAYKGSAFGSASQNIQVADPIVLASGLPRFASPGDTLVVPVTISNTTAKATTAIAQVSAEGGFKVVGNASTTVPVAANSEAQALFKVVAQNAIGTGKVISKVQALNETFTEATDLTIRPITSLIKQSGAGEVTGGSSATIKEFSNTAAFLPKTMQARLVVSRTPLVRFTDDISFLLHYPYGCTEQTISAAFPQLVYADLTRALRQAQNKQLRGNSGLRNPQQNVQDAIRKIEGLQLHNGGLSMWPGSFEENWWASAYAAHFLTEADQAGFEVNQATLDRLLQYLAQKAKGNETELYYFTDAKGQTAAKTMVAKEVAYSLYVLAIAGKPERATMNRYKPQAKQLPIDSRYLLAAAYSAIGDKESFRALLPSAFSTEKTNPETGGSFASYVRDQGVALYALVSADPNNPQVGELARRLSEQMQGQGNYSTQERVWAILALGRVARQNRDATVTATISANGKQIGNFTGETLTLNQNLAGQNISINTKGTGKLYYFWELSGTGTGAYKEEDRNLQVRRTYLDRDGNPITNNRFEQNDLVVVKVSVKAANNARVDNVVVTDMLPAGFEIENPRIGAVASLVWIKDAAQPEHFDVRDDRIHFFTSLNSPKTRSADYVEDYQERAQRQNQTGEQHFYYLVRAVSRGNFAAGPASADAMYNGAYHSTHGGGRIKISERQATQSSL